jgi:hypothetical protein
VLVVWKLDRLSRSLKDLLQIMERVREVGAGFRSLTEAVDTTTAAGRMMMQMLGSFAEFERSMVRERTRAGLAAARDRGVKVGRPAKLSPHLSGPFARAPGSPLMRLGSSACTLQHYSFAGACGGVDRTICSKVQNNFEHRMPVSSLPLNVLERICDVLADTSTGFTGSEIGKPLSRLNIADPQPQMTKRVRLYEALRQRQDTDRCANLVVAFMALR